HALEMVAIKRQVTKPKSSEVEPLSNRNTKGEKEMNNWFVACAKGSLLPQWVLYWLKFSTVICTLDVTYMMMRPMTSRGGGWLAVVFEGWNIYADFDYRYADPNDLFTMMTSRVMILELIMNILAIRMNNRRSRHTVPTAFTTTAFVFWKTVMYFTIYIRQPEGTQVYINPDASLLQHIFVFYIPNSIWVIMPLLVMVALWD
ncbi:hypothetical protein PENTCL1PPCAC_19368, partial [Pristionchus entomophagus]